MRDQTSVKRFNPHTHRVNQLANTSGKIPHKLTFERDKTTVLCTNQVKLMRSESRAVCPIILSLRLLVHAVQTASLIITLCPSKRTSSTKPFDPGGSVTHFSSLKGRKEKETTKCWYLDNRIVIQRAALDASSMQDQHLHRDANPTPSSQMV